jgi:hypothetical protein
MKNVKLKINPTSNLSLRTNVRSLEVLYRFRDSLDVSNPFDMTIQKFLIRKAL